MVKVRDAALKIKDELPKSDVNREYYLQVCKTNHQQYIHGYYNSLTINNISMDTERKIFSHGHFQNVDSALAESASIGPGGALGKLPR